MNPLFSLLCCASFLNVAAAAYHRTPDEAASAEGRQYLDMLSTILKRAQKISAWTEIDASKFDFNDIVAANIPRKGRKNSGINYCDINGTKILVKRLLDLRHDFNMGKLELGSYLMGGKSCNAQQVERQDQYVKREAPNLCWSIEAYKLAQLAWPDASVFLEIGTGRGFLSTLLISLWGGGGYGITPWHLYKIYLSSKGERNPSGFCRVGINKGYPLHCPDPHREADGKCNWKNPSFTLYSIDDSSAAIDRINSQLIQNDTFMKETDGRGVWKAFHYAGASPGSPGIFDFVEGNGILNYIDVIKFSGNKAALVDVLKLTKIGKVGLVTFERTNMSTDKFKGIIDEFEVLKYDCYIPYYIGLVKITGACWKTPLVSNNGFNVFCASRLHAPGVVMVYDAMMLGHTDDYYWPHR